MRKILALLLVPFALQAQPAPPSGGVPTPSQQT